MIIDSHHHLWRYSPEEYGWIGPGMETIKRDFLIPELESAVGSTPVEATIAVQARQTVAETRALLEFARGNSPIAGVTGWLPLASDDLEEYLEEFAEEPLLKGLRHVVQDEPDPAFILGEAFNRGVALAGSRGLIYEILITCDQLPQAIEFASRHTGIPLVLDHIAKPRIRAGERDEWARGIRRLGKFENLSCKLSGLVTEADPHHWSTEQLRPYVETVLDAFGPERLMFGSDWPVCLLASDYSRWYNCVRELIGSLSADEQTRIMGGTAAAVYGIAATAADTHQGAAKQ